MINLYANKHFFKAENKLNKLFFILMVTFYIAYPLSLSAQDKRAAGANLMPVNVERVKKADISLQLETSGNVEPFLSAFIHPKTNGEVIKINVSEGSVVKPGDLLAEIDHRILDAQLEQAQAAVTVAKASLDVQTVQVESAKTALVAARAQADAARAQADNLALTRKRFEELFKEGAISEQQFDDVVAKHDSAKAQKISADSQILQAEDAIETSKVTLKVKKAQLEQAVANLHSVEVQRENAFIRAPFAGIITQRIVDPGAMASVAQPILRLEQMKPIKVIGTLVEKDLMRLKAGETQASVKVDVFNRPFTGVVEKIYPAIESKTRTGKFEIILDNSENILRSGLFAKINLYLKKVKNAVVVSKDALLNQKGQLVAIKVNKDGIAQKVVLKTGIVQNTRIEILEGLEPGDLIISQGAELVKTGIKVRPVLAEEEQ